MTVCGVRTILHTWRVAVAGTPESASRETARASAATSTWSGVCSTTMVVASPRVGSTIQPRKAGSANGLHMAYTNVIDRGATEPAQTLKPGCLRMLKIQPQFAGGNACGAFINHLVIPAGRGSPRGGRRPLSACGAGAYAMTAPFARFHRTSVTETACGEFRYGRHRSPGTRRSDVTI